MNAIGEELLIRDAKESDLNAILETQNTAYNIQTGWLTPEQTPLLNETIEDVHHDFIHKTILVACVVGMVVGSVRYTIKSGVCVLERMSVLPSFQKRGIGKKLVETVEQQSGPQAHKIYLETELMANDLIRYYTGLGYSAEAVLRKHYGKADWIAFSKFVDNA